MDIGKALILTGGERIGRSWPTAPGEPKHLFPIANRPILFHNLAALRDAGVRDAAILVEPDSAAATQEAVGDGSRWDLSVRCQEWTPAVGLRGALANGQCFVGDEPVLVQRGDALLRNRMDSLFSAFSAEQLDAMALQLDAPTEILRPGWLLSPRAVSILIEERGDSAGPMADVRAHGGRVRIEHVDGMLACSGDQDALLECNRTMLEGLVGATNGADVEDSVLQGAVQLHPTAVVRGSTIRGPAVIGAGAHIADAYVGPYTAIGANATIEGTEIEHSIVLPDARVSFLGTRVESSVIGRRARVGRSFRLPGAIRLSIGEGAEVTLA